MAASIDRSTHYEWLTTDPAYANAFHGAMEEAADGLEAEARRRAAKGVKRLKFHQGEPITDPETNEPYFEHEYSDTLLIFLLKSIRPEKYRDRQHVQHAGHIEHEHSGAVHFYLPEKGDEVQQQINRLRAATTTGKGNGRRNGHG